MNKMVIEFLDEQIEMVEELCGDLTADEKEALKNRFFKSFEKIADEFHIDVNLIYENFHSVLIPIYESDFDSNVAAEVILATGGDY